MLAPVASTAARLAVDSVRATIRDGDLDGALRYLETTLATVQSAGDWTVLGTLVPDLELHIALSSPRWAAATAKLVTCGGHGNPEGFFRRAIATYSAHRAPGLWLEWGFELYLSARTEEAEVVLERVLPRLRGEALGQAWRRLGLTRFARHRADWPVCFERALAAFNAPRSGRARGQVLLDHATCLYTDGATLEARDLALEALPLFKRDPLLRTRALILVGVILTRLLDPEAATFLEQAEVNTRTGHATVWRAQALQSLAFAHRVRGDWSRSEYRLRQALETCHAERERASVRYALGSLYRQMNQPNLARREFAEVTHADFAEAVTLERAALELEAVSNGTGRLEVARSELSTMTALRGGDLALWRVLRAELARRENDRETMLRELWALDPRSRVAREEVRRFPALFDAARASKLEVPRPLERVRRRDVQVYTTGSLRVYVDGRRVERIAPESRSGALLLRLLCSPGLVCDIDALRQALYPEKARQSRDATAAALRSLARTLEDQLGWRGAVTKLRGAYALDDATTWSLDPNGAR
jgi:tetratricopeptide (TPR) repeat protein